jgi:sucrose-6-phosphate hydrolase SacC (GH32 family)
LHLRVLTDRTALEIFGADGFTYLPMAVISKVDQNSLGIHAREGTAKIRALEVSEMRSIWAEKTGKR